MISASPVTRERGFATTAALNVYTSVGPVRPTGGLSGCVAELRAYIDAAGIAEDRKGWLCGCSNGQLVIGEAEKADLLATNQGVQGKINGCDNGSRSIETQAPRP